MLPEYHLTGWVPEDPQFGAIASTAYQYVRQYQSLAKELQINIVPGTIVTTPNGDEPITANGGTTESESKLEKPILLNIAPFISSTGDLLGTYTKTNLWHTERPHLTSGAQSNQPLPPGSRDPRPSPHRVIETPLGPVGILVCWDLAFPEPFRSLIRQGARIIIIPTFWLATDLSPEGLRYNKDAEALFVKSTLTCRAFENTCAIVFVNAGGAAEEGYIGLSQVTLPLIGPAPGSFEDAEEGVRIVDVDLNTADIAEKTYKIRQDLAGEDWHYGYSHGK